MYIVIVNEKAGNGKAAGKWRRIEEELQKEGVPYRATSAFPVNKDLFKRGDISGIVVIGGDGTCHEVINLPETDDIPLAIVPAGSGNDFARSIGADSSAAEVVGRLKNRDIRMTDVLQVDGRRCMTVCGIGFDGTVASLTNKFRLKKYLGRLSYVINVLRALGSYVPEDVTVTVDGEANTYSGVWLVAAANFPFYGGGMKICPEADAQDDQIDICLVHGMNKPRLLKLFPRVFSGSHIGAEGVITVRGRDIKVESTAPLVIHGDGEILGTTPVNVTVSKKKIPLIY
ncbi:diacylglycerol/lipid kinase family protein [Alteribacter natronophilus]|uniref:diacylglycerol/lipid kinase family protein n=1 Tax=Alteribacter natronophilus TaxID=2583810 RepID=UPI0014862DDB|nr:diacylglycerol kinase family protein [Alteribacter natronophilus]